MTPLSDDYFELMNTRTDHLHDWRHVPAQTTPQSLPAPYQVCQTCADSGVLTVRVDAAGHPVDAADQPDASALSAEEEETVVGLAVLFRDALSDLFPGGAS